jgi:hypothetical protein
MKEFVTRYFQVYDTGQHFKTSESDRYIGTAVSKTYGVSHCYELHPLHPDL